MEVMLSDGITAYKDIGNKDSKVIVIPFALIDEAKLVFNGF